MTSKGGRQITVSAQDDTATLRIGSDIALALPPQVMIHLHGDLGAGKTALARAIIRSLLEDETAEVPSPTFSLVQHYQYEKSGRDCEIVHADLYRIGDAAEVDELGLADTVSNRITLVEWPERGEGSLPDSDLDISIFPQENEDGSEGRSFQFTGREDVLARIERSFLISDFLEHNWQKDAHRTFLLGDASARTYETATLKSEKRILMNAPRQPDGPVIRDGKPYSQIAHLAEDVSAFVGVAGIVKSFGMRVPEIHAADLENGLLLTEDLGTSQIITADRSPIAGRYIASAEMLAVMHSRPLVRSFDLGNGREHRVPDYDRTAMLIEAELLPDWYIPRFKGAPLSTSERGQFLAIWNNLIDELGSSEKHLVLRDFHSPNIIWQDGATGTDRIGLIDFQDAVIGPTAYDVASLAQDARVDIPRELETEIVDAYCAARRDGGSFDETEFRRDYAIMAAQRASKILGIFVRLDERDHKPAYLKHLPRMQDYIRRSLSHPVLVAYREWFTHTLETAGETVT